MAAGGNFVTLCLKSLGLRKLGSYGETTELSQPLIPVGLFLLGPLHGSGLSVPLAIYLSQLSLRRQLPVTTAGGVTVPMLVS